jgi:UDP-glucuronate decarboxylase
MRTDLGVTGPINLGNPQEITVGELAESVTALVNPTLKVRYLPLPEDDPQKRQPNIDLARATLGGWEPKISLESGLERTVEWFRDVYGI